jgi:hypothetical protein
MHELGERVYVDPVERDIARFKLLRLDPGQRHVRYDLKKVRNLAELWNAVQTLAPTRPAEEVIYRLKVSAQMYDAAQAQLPPEVKAQMAQYENLLERTREDKTLASAQVTLSKHVIINDVAMLMGAQQNYWE